jgi:hypothetical protein
VTLPPMEPPMDICPHPLVPPFMWRCADVVDGSTCGPCVPYSALLLLGTSGFVRGTQVAFAKEHWLLSWAHTLTGFQDSLLAISMSSQTHIILPLLLFWEVGRWFRFELKVSLLYSWCSAPWNTPPVSIAVSILEVGSPKLFAMTSPEPWSSGSWPSN